MISTQVAYEIKEAVFNSDAFYFIHFFFCKIEIKDLPLANIKAEQFVFTCVHV